MIWRLLSWLRRRRLIGIYVYCAGCRRITPTRRATWMRPLGAYVCASCRTPVR